MKKALVTFNLILAAVVIIIVSGNITYRKQNEKTVKKAAGESSANQSNSRKALTRVSGYATTAKPALVGKVTLHIKGGTVRGLAADGYWS